MLSDIELLELSLVTSNKSLKLAKAVTAGYFDKGELFISRGKLCNVWEAAYLNITTVKLLVCYLYNEYEGKDAEIARRFRKGKRSIKEVLDNLSVVTLEIRKPTLPPELKEYIDTASSAFKELEDQCCEFFKPL